MSKVQVTKKYTLTGHKDCIYTILGSGEPSKFFSAAGDGMVVQWNLEDTEKGEVVAKVDASVYAMDYDLQNDTLVVGQNYEGIHLLEVKGKKHIGSLKLTSSAIFDLKFYEDKILAGTGEGELIIIDRKRLQIQKRLKLSDRSLRTLEIDYFNRRLIAGFSDTSIRVLEMEQFSLIKEINSHSNSVFTVCYSPNQNFLLSAGRDARLKIWDANHEYELVNEIVAHMYAINHITFSPDGNYFATCSMDKSIKIWDAAEFKLLKVIDKARHAGHGTSVNKLYWSTYNNFLISCSDDRSISVWEIAFE